MKDKRHAKILELIAAKEVETQEEILAFLCEHGFPVTQATVSRDIRELKLVKTQGAGGRYKYTASITSKAADASGKFISIFKETVTAIDYANNLVVVKCLVGMANAACAALDAVHYEGIVGTLSGDDTVLIIMRDEKMAVALVSELKKML